LNGLHKHIQFGDNLSCVYASTAMINPCTKFEVRALLFPIWDGP